MKFSELSSINVKRAGVLLFTKNGDNEYIFLVGRKKWGIYTDFAGSAEKDENAAQCALREFKEESGLSIKIHPDSEVLMYDCGERLCCVVLVFLNFATLKSIKENFRATEEIREVFLMKVTTLLQACSVPNTFPEGMDRLQKVRYRAKNPCPNPSFAKLVASDVFRKRFKITDVND